MTSTASTRGLVVGGLLAAVWLLQGCGSAGPASSGDGGAAGAAGSGSSGSSTGGSGGAGRGGASGRAGEPGVVLPPAPTTCAGSPRPEVIPADWSEWTGWSCECSLLGPGTTGTPYAPLGWEPCELPYPSSVVCERSTHPWHSTAPLYYTGITPEMRRDPVTGHPLLQATHAVPTGGDAVLFHFVADVTTGQMKSVLAQPSTRDCARSDGGTGQYFPGGMGTEQALLSYHGVADKERTTPEGWLEARFDQPWPSQIVKKDHTSPVTNSSWYGSGVGVVRNISTTSRFDWDGQNEELLYGPALDPDGLQTFLPFLTDEAVFFPVGGLVRNGVWGWSKATGLRALLRWPDDATRGAGNFATDGKDMVWIYGEGKKAGTEEPYPKRSVMTAPYSLDPPTVAKTTRRLRSQPGNMGPWSYQVGCGYAARSVTVNDDKTFNGLFIVRLSDGVSWTLPGAPNVADLAWEHTLHVDCEHVYMSISNAKKARIGRVRLDSLGPGTAPD